ncbi:RAM signaling pathway protein-domain-containing protein [Lentinula edodes]|nr:RAM signaling pathway protein-domain-containing protein [Lentinula edodes]
MSLLDAEHLVHQSPSSRKHGAFPPISLDSSHIQEALARSNDGGVTLVLMKKNFADVGSDAAEELATICREFPEDECRVQRISLGHNRLTTLPMEFALLSRLRYLNLKSNCFSVFPDVLTLMPAIDTLDISHNKIKRLPSQPGHLVNLRVFCFSRNKVTRLPVYLSRFHNLTVLQADKNPIEWPPKAVMEPPNLVADGAKFSISWIKSIQKWIESETTSEIHPHDDSGFSEHHDLESRLDEAYSAWSSRLPRTDIEFDDGVTPHARSFSIDSNFSMSSATESVNLDTPASSYGQSDRPPPLHLGILQSYSEEASPTRSIESYLPSPAESDTFFDSTSTHDHADLDQQSQSQQQQQHARNASYAAGSIRSSNRPDFLGKKSMPDLRTAKLNFSKKSVPDSLQHTRVDRGFTTKSSSANSPSTSTPTNTHSHRPNLHHPHEDSFSIPSPLSQRQDSSGSSNTSNSRAIRGPFSVAKDKDFIAQVSPTRAVPSMAFERNSYFRRISSLPTASISNTLPPPLLNLVDTARSILFAVCQIYQTLEHYTLHHTIDDRLSSVLKKVLHPASTDMMQFINSLDRFDAMSRKTVPPPTVCRGVVESCRDTVAVFGKTVGVLSLQLKVIVSVDDLRYVRALLIQLYSAAAEISLAWQGMIPLMDSVKPYLHSKAFPTPSPPNHVGLGNIDNNLYHSPASAPLLPTSLSLSEGSPSHLLSLRANPSGVRTHTARRHAGSFSSKDVEIGKTLPSCEEMPSLSGGIALHTPTLRTPKRKNGSATTPTTMLTIQAPSPTGPISLSNSSSSLATSTISVSASIAESSRAVHSAHSHSRSGSQTSIIAGSSSNPSSSAASSPSLPPPKPTSFLELPSTSRTLVDNEALQAVQAAVEVAPTVWDMIENVLLGNEEGKGVKAGVNLLEMKESLDNARAITSRLTECLQAMRNKEGGDVGSERKSLREDAHLFLKSVVQLSNAIKTYGGARSSALRTNMVKLTNSTEEFAILLHVSSFTPLAAPTAVASSSTSIRPYSPSPMLNASVPAVPSPLPSVLYSQSQTNLLHLPEIENRGLGLGPALSRSRSAQGSTTNKLPPSPAPTEAPRSAQPLQSFKLPVIRRLRDREAANGFRIDGITGGTGLHGNGNGIGNDPG